MTDSKIITVADVMSRSLRTIGGMATVQDAIDSMREAGVSSLVVERRDETDEYGMVVVSDIATSVIATDRAPERVNVYEVMTKPVLTLPASMSIRYAVRQLVRFRLARAIVEGDGRHPVGIVTLRDMVLRYSGEPPLKLLRRESDRRRAEDA